jgi:hypothetical protein
MYVCMYALIQKCQCLCIDALARGPGPGPGVNRGDNICITPPGKDKNLI